MERLTSSSEYSSLTMEVTGKTSREHDISFKDSERTNVIINCDPCENEGDEQPAEGFCENCQEYLCASCFKIHRRPAVWRHHVLLDKENMPSPKETKEQLNYECTEPCSEHSTKVLEYFCQTHSQLGCAVCITTKHRKCNDVDYIQHIADKFKESTEVKETYKTLQSLKDDINTYSAIVSKDKMKVKTYEKNAKEHILQLRDEFDSICNRLVDNVEHVSKCDESNIEDSLKTCEEILNKIKLRQSVLEKKQAEMKVSQLFTEAKLSQLSAKEYRRELETIKECTKSRHYEIKCDIEALREMIKLTFRDQQNENDPSCAKVSSEYEYPQKNTIKQGHIHNLKFDSTTDRKEKNEENKSGYAREQLKSPADRKPVTKENHFYRNERLRESESSKYETERKPETQEYRVYEKERLRECESSKYKLGSKTDCVLKNEEKNSGDERKHSKTPVYEYKNIRHDSKTDNKKEIEEKKSGGAWGHSIYPVTRRAFDKSEKIHQISKISGDAWGHSKSKGNWDTLEKETTDYKKSVDSSEHSKSEVNWKAYDKKENVEKISEDVCELPRSPANWNTYEKETVVDERSVDSSIHSKSEVNWRTNDKKENEDKTEYLYGNDKGLNRANWNNDGKVDYETSRDAWEHSKSEIPPQNEYQTSGTYGISQSSRRKKKNHRGRRYEES